MLQQSRRLSFVLSGLSSLILASACYWLLFNSIIETAAFPGKYIALGKQLQQITDPEVYQKVCHSLVDNLDGAEMAFHSAGEMIRAASTFLIVGSGLVFLLSLRLLRATSAQPSMGENHSGRPGMVGRGIDFLIDAWEGKLKLRQAFWGLHVLSTIAGGLVVILLAKQIDKSSGMVSLLYISLLLGALLVLYIFGLSAVWKNARNVQRKLFFWIARVVVFVEALAMSVKVAAAVLTMWPVYKIIALM